MKQLAINIAKNTEIKNLACTPNTVVLAKQTTSTNAKTGEVTTTIRYIEVCPIEKTDPLCIVQSLLKYIVAEFFVCKELETDFAETNIKQRKLFNQFLTGDTIYRTDSTGKITNALISEVPLNRTALRVQKTHNVVICKPENRKAAITNTQRQSERNARILALSRKRLKHSTKRPKKPKQRPHRHERPNPVPPRPKRQPEPLHKSAPHTQTVNRPR